MKLNLRKARIHMIRLDHIAQFVSGSPQFRIAEAIDDKARLYTYYRQSEIENDLTGMDSNHGDRKQIRTFDQLNTLCQGDLVFSLVSGKSTIVSARHEGYLYTQNYVKLVTGENVDSKYLAYLLNEDKFVRKQLLLGLQGSQVLKYTLKQLKELELFNIPKLEKQQMIGELYFNQLRLEALRNRNSKLETILVLEGLEEANNK
ncbi:restriction endonuclease subunit M [Paenibacillus sp. FSL H8-0079]|uniref:restriction endonuclease subunit M n=1 Tax=Paenibacillus sp. FSL H8-0079 TaxID=2921375 RepID=UPI0030EDF70D